MPDMYDALRDWQSGLLTEGTPQIDVESEHLNRMPDALQEWERELLTEGMPLQDYLARHPSARSAVDAMYNTARSSTVTREDLGLPLVRPFPLDLDFNPESPSTRGFIEAFQNVGYAATEAASAVRWTYANILNTEPKEDTMTLNDNMMKAATERNISALIHSYTYENDITVDGLLADAETNRKFRKDADKIKRAYHRWVASLTEEQKEEYWPTVYVHLYWTKDIRDRRSVRVSTGLSDVRMECAAWTPKYIPVEEAIERLKAVLPAWVDVNVVTDQYETFLAYTTERGEIFKNIVESHLGNVYLRSSDYSIDREGLKTYIRAAKGFTEQAPRLILNRMKADALKKSDTKVSKVRSGAGNIHAYFDSLRALPKPEEQIIDKFEILPHGLKSSRSWGIEVESGGARGVDTPAGWKAKYDGSLRSAYTGQFAEDEEDTWDCEEDHEPSIQTYSDTLQRYIYHANDDFTPEDECDACMHNAALANGDTPQDGDCREFVSPILHSYHSKGLEALVTALNENPQNDSAGVHVHVGVDDMTPRQIGSLVHGYNRIENLLTSSYRRTKREYCKERTSYEIQSVCQSAKTVTQLEDLYSGDRYTSLNLQSIQSHGTVEFRAMGPVYEYEHLIKWAYFCREMVNVSRTATAKDWNKIQNFSDLLALFAAKGKETVDNSLSSISDDEIEAFVSDRYTSGNGVFMEQRLFAGVNGEI